MNALSSVGFEQLQGIVESDETFFKESMKGKQKVTHREANERGGKVQKRGIFNLFMNSHLIRFIEMLGGVGTVCMILTLMQNCCGNIIT